MTTSCVHCNAVRFANETNSLCCGNGKIRLTPFPHPPPELQALFSEQSVDSEHFLSNIRKYNAAFQMTSFGCSEITLAGWNPTFKIQGQVCHLIGPLQAEEGVSERFLQIYFLDGEEQIDARMSIFSGLRRPLITNLQQMLFDNNTYVQDLKMAYEYARKGNTNYSLVIHEDARPTGEHARRYNAAHTNEVAVLMPNDAIGQRDVVLRQRDNQIRRICELHRAYDTLQYPLLFPYGTDGWSLQLKLAHKVTQLQFYCFHLMTRSGNYLLQARKLLQQYIVDVYAKVEAERLSFLRREQGRLRSDCYQNLRDALFQDDGNPHNVGQRVILPSSFTGGPRYMHERQQDALLYVQRFGRPHLFVTVTTNPKWPEITEQLKPRQKSFDRPDLLVRVFKQKLVKLMKILKDGAFGSLQAWVYSIEFQKRGLPHAHILLWLPKDHAIRPDQIDNAVVAEIPDKEQDPELYEIVTSNMIHGPCGQLNPHSVCMKNGRCSKGFPKNFLRETEQDGDSYPRYRRRTPEEGGGSATIKKKLEGSLQNVEIDSRWVVPYNPWLLRQMGCHVNVEMCSSVKCIKYVLKYIHKGSDQATFRIEGGQRDEISEFLNARYVGCTEAAWRIFELQYMNDIHPYFSLLCTWKMASESILQRIQLSREPLLNPPKLLSLHILVSAEMITLPELCYILMFQNITPGAKPNGTKEKGGNVVQREFLKLTWSVGCTPLAPVWENVFS